jgi:MazG family protein
LSKPSSKKKLHARVAGKRSRRRAPAARFKGGRARPSFDDLVALQARLLAPQGCPWDREQTHESLRTYLVEETYEVLDALESGDRKKFASELGDLLLQIVFHAQLAAQRGDFDIGDVIEHIHSKMVRRHPHVFGEAKARDAAQVLKNWEELKVQERNSEKGKGEESASLMDDIPRNVPAAHEAYQLTRRASRIGFDWDDLDGLLEKLQEEVRELRGAMGKKDGRGVEEEIGDLLFVAANVARFLCVDPEIALKKANRKFVARFREMEREMERRGGKLANASREEMERLWERSKLTESPARKRR